MLSHVQNLGETCAGKVDEPRMQGLQKLVNNSMHVCLNVYTQECPALVDEDHWNV